MVDNLVPDFSGQIETEIHELLDSIHVYADSIGLYITSHPGTSNLIWGLMSGVAAVPVILAAPEVAVAGLAIEGIAEIGLASGAIKALSYVAGAMGSAGALVEFAIGALERASWIKVTPDQQKSISQSIDYTDPFSLVFSTFNGSLIALSGHNDPPSIEKALEQGINVGKFASLTLELNELGKAIYKHDFKEIAKETYNTGVQLAGMNGTPHFSPGILENLIQQSIHTGSHLTAEFEPGHPSVVLHSPQYSNLLSSNGIENGLHIGSLSVDKNQIANHYDEPHWSWEHHDGNSKQISSLIGNSGFDNFHTYPQVHNVSKLYPQKPNQPLNAHLPASSISQIDSSKEPSIPPPMGGTSSPTRLP